jgi:hypothetical protein
MLNNYGCKHTLRLYKNIWISKAIKFRRTHTNITLYVHCLSCHYVAGIIPLYGCYLEFRSFRIIKFSNDENWMLTSEDGLKNFPSSLSDDSLPWNHQNHFFKIKMSGTSIIQSTSTITKPQYHDVHHKSPHYLYWDLTWISTVENRQQTAWDTVQPVLLSNVWFSGEEMFLEPTDYVIYFQETMQNQG